MAGATKSAVTDELLPDVPLTAVRVDATLPAASVWVNSKVSDASSVSVPLRVLVKVLEVPS